MPQNRKQAMNRQNKFIIIIPARYGSSRFPGKPLAKIGGVEMIVHVCRQASQVTDEVVVATDDTRIKNCVEAAGFRAVMTSDKHRSGTDRVREAYEKSGSSANVIINIQGDEPFIEPRQIRQLMDCFDTPATEIATLCRKFNPQKGFDALFDPNLVKVTLSARGEALYFSRSIIPYVRGVDCAQWLAAADFHTHIGIYAYCSDVLAQITDLPQSPLEKAESLEQLRWLENGYRIRIAVSEFDTIGIDTPDDLAAAERHWSATH